MYNQFEQLHLERNILYIADAQVHAATKKEVSTY